MIGVNYNGLRYELICVCLFNGIGIVDESLCENYF